jgi:hypothetical protein
MMKLMLCDYVKIKAEEYEADEEIVNICHSMLNLVCCFLFILYFIYLVYFIISSQSEGYYLKYYYYHL